jgi:hypothetical protein
MSMIPTFPVSFIALRCPLKARYTTLEAPAKSLLNRNRESRHHKSSALTCTVSAECPWVVKDAFCAFEV